MRLPDKITLSQDKVLLVLLFVSIIIATVIIVLLIVISTIAKTLTLTVDIGVVAGIMTIVFVIGAVVIVVTADSNIGKAGKTLLDIICSQFVKTSHNIWCEGR